MSSLVEVLGGAVAGAVAGALCTGVASYYVGRKHGREQLRYEQRVEAVKKLFTLIREAQWELVNASAPPDIEFEGNPSRKERANDMDEKLDELDGYRRDSSAWLTEEANKKLSQLVDTFYEALAELRVRLEECDDEDTAAEFIYEEKVEETAKLMFEVFDVLVESL